jgi:hypothetical protein
MIVANRGKKDLVSLVECIKTNKEEDFYLTENNQRIYVETIKQLKKLIKDSTHVYYETNDCEINGLILVWKSKGGDLVRNYVKVSAKNPIEAEKLLTLLLWNFKNELYVKLRKGSPLINVFRGKGFHFEGGRGSQVLLKKEKFVNRNENVVKEENKTHISRR